MNPSQSQLCRWHPFPNTEALEHAAVDRILRAAQRAIARAGAFHLVLSGGNTPRHIYQALGLCAADWPRWHVYFSDERCLPCDDSARNSQMAADAFLQRVTIPSAQIYPMPAELGAGPAASAYGQTLKGLGDFDLVLLGLGEDGHTASLFPGHDWGSSTDAADVVPVFNAPKPPPERVSLSARRLSAAREVIFLVSGVGKRDAIAAWRAGTVMPAAAITPPGGVDILLDFALP